MMTVGPILDIVPIQNAIDIQLNVSTDLNIIVLKFGLDMFLRNINDLTKYGPDRRIFGSSPHINVLLDFLPSYFVAKIMCITAKFFYFYYLLDPIFSG